jgi:FAD/FMN-containing dehydrogenase
MDLISAGAELEKVSRDTSLFQRVPAAVAYPASAEELSGLVKDIRARKAANPQDHTASLTGRAAGTDMSGGPLNDGTIAVFTKHLNHVDEVATDAIREDGTSGYAVTEPGVYYRDFEKETLAKGLVLPSYPASREIAAMGGIVSNNSGGERTLEYGKTEKYIESSWKSCFRTAPSPPSSRSSYRAPHEKSEEGS